MKGYEWLRENVVTPQNIEVVKQLEPISKDLGCTLAQLALAWCGANKNVSTVITGATSRKQVVENLRAADWIPKLDGDIMKRVSSIVAQKPQIEVD